MLFRRPAAAPRGRQEGGTEGAGARLPAKITHPALPEAMKEPGTAHSRRKARRCWVSLTVRKREHNPAPPRAPLRAAAGAPRRRIQAAPGPRRTDRPPCAGGGNRAKLPVKGGPGECPPGKQGGAAYSRRGQGGPPPGAPQRLRPAAARMRPPSGRGARRAPPAGRGRGGPQAAQLKATPGAPLRFAPGFNVRGGDVPAGRCSGAVPLAALTTLWYNGPGKQECLAALTRPEAMIGAATALSAGWPW